MSYHVVISDTIAFFLKQKDLTEKQLAEKINLPEETFNQKRCGKDEFTLFEIAHLSEILGVTLDEITGINKAEQLNLAH